MLNTRSKVPLAGLLVLGCMLGCDSGPPTAPVKGKVTYEGKVVPKGTVYFRPKEGGRAAVGPIQSDGTYELARRTPGDEVVLGEYIVTIEANEITGAAPAPTSLAAEMEGPAGASTEAEINWLVPKKYSIAETSDLTATVTDTNNEINFDIK